MDGEDDRTNVELFGFTLDECVVEVDAEAARYLRAVHSTALELASRNLFGPTVGGFWCSRREIAELRRFPEFYSGEQSVHVARAVDAYLKAQLGELYRLI